MTKIPPLLSAPDIKGIRGNVIIDFTINAALSRDAPTLGQARPSKYQPSSPFTETSGREERGREHRDEGGATRGFEEKSASLVVQLIRAADRFVSP